MGGRGEGKGRGKDRLREAMIIEGRREEGMGGEGKGKREGNAKTVRGRGGSTKRFCLR